MQRNLYQKLLAWKSSNQRKPLILKGARQVGKTYLLKQFGKQEYQTMVYLNFEENKEIAALFTANLDPLAIIKNLELLFQQNITPANTLLIFDEIQECPNALNSLKYFNENANQFHIIAAGSLLGVKLAANEKGFPVGKVNFLELFPLCFPEFLAAINKSNFVDYLNNLSTKDDIAEPIHNELIRLLKEFFIVGGMPEVVAAYATNPDLQTIRTIQKEIIEAYTFDFAKHAPSTQVMKIMEIWQSIPSQLAKENKKFIFSAISKSARAREYETAIQWLNDAGLIYKNYAISTPKIPLDGYSERQIFKLFLLDVGLLGAMSNLPAKVILDGHDLFSEFKGALTENFVAQTLVTYLDKKLFYWTSAGSAEIDFIVEHELNIYPLEVKSGISIRSKSLQIYKEKYQPKLLSRTSLLNLTSQDNFINYPLYMVHRFPSL